MRSCRACWPRHSLGSCRSAPKSEFLSKTDPPLDRVGFCLKIVTAALHPRQEGPDAREGK
jgi:hypothetical protein